MPLPGRPHLISTISASRSSADSRRLVPSGIWLSIWRPSPAQPWQAWQFPFCLNSRMPATMSAGSFACGSNGGPPRQQLSGFGDFGRCRAEANGLREVYFEYDDEYEYIARARDLPREISRWAGTTEAGFPVVVSGLFNDNGVLKGIR